LLSIPTVAASFLYELLKIHKTFQLPEGWLNVAFGSTAAFISGILAIKIMMEFLKTRSLKIFGIYRVVLGIILVLYYFFK